ncbi:membrane dipeptidase-domain-containing protein [Cyathus striatus]|nr:membrane dipeptidase-domain-containing protein [Cyathus striatus]
MPSSSARRDHESAPLLNSTRNEEYRAANPKTRAIVWGALTLLFGAALVLFLAFGNSVSDSLAPWVGRLPQDPMLAALAILEKAPVIDGHIDLPILVRYYYSNNVSQIDLNSEMPAHVDIPRLKEGKVGGFFWSTYVSCADPDAEGSEFVNATWRVRDTLEQIDISKLLIEKYPETFELALTSQDIKRAISNGKIASMLGVEGGHQLGNSIAVLRQYHALGVRYVTLTHVCHNAFADSCGYLPGIIPLHGGLSELGKSLIQEMNRLGVLVDLSHTSDATATQALNYSSAPVIWSHSSARAIHNVPRNVPDDILKLIGTGPGQRDAVVMINFAPFFIAPPGKATVETVANHIDHVAHIAGRKHVGLGSDFDGIGDVPVGLEDVSKYPALIAELYRRGWNKYEIAGLTGANLLRVFEGAEKVAKELQSRGIPPVTDIYHKRPDLPVQREEF